MADPISIAALAVSLAFKVGNVTVTTQQFMQHVRDSRMEMDRVSQELGSLKFALEMLAEDARTPGVAVPPALQHILRNCEEVVTKLECDLAKYN
jgi:signal transduction histidine kinase